MLSKIKRLSSTSCRIQISIDLQELHIVKKIEDVNLICIEFERKTKSISSQSKIWSGEKYPNMVRFDESLTLLVTLYRDSSGIFLEKGGMLVLKGYSEKKSSSVQLGSASIKLSALAADYAPQKLNLTLNDEKGNRIGVLNVSAHAKYLRDVDAGDDESSVTSYKSELLSLSVPASDRLSHSAVYKDSASAKMYGEDLTREESQSKDEMDKYRRCLATTVSRPPVTRKASFLFGKKDTDSCDIDSITSGMMSGDVSPLKTRKNTLGSSTTDSPHPHFEDTETLTSNKLLKAQVEDLTAQLLAAEAKLSAETERADALKDREVISFAEILSLKTALGAGDSRYSEKDARLAKLAEEKKDLKLRLIQSEQNEHTLEKAVASLRKDVHVAQCESAAVQAAVLTIELQKLQSAMVKMKEQAAVSLTERSGLITDLESTKSLLVETEEKLQLVKNDKKMAQMHEEQQELHDNATANARKIKELEDRIEDLELEKKMSDKLEEDVERISSEATKRYDSMVARMQSKIEKLSVDSNKWKARFEEGADKNDELLELTQKKELVSNETIEHLQQELEEALDQLTNANDLSMEQQRVIETSADKIKEYDTLSALKLDLQSANKSLANSQELVLTLQGKLATAESVIESSSAAAALKALEFDRVKKELIDSLEALSLLENDVEKTMTEWTEKEDNMDSQVKDLTEKCSLLEVKEGLASGLVSDMDRQLILKTEQLTVTEKSVESLTKNVSDQTLKIDKMMKEIEALHKSCHQQKVESEKQDKFIESQKIVIEEQVKEIEKKSKEVKVLKNELDDLAIEMERKVKVSETARSELADTALEISKRNKSFEALSTENETHLFEIKKRDKIIESLRGDQTEEIEKMVKVVQGLKEQLADQSEELEKREKLLKASRSELADQISETEKRVMVIKTLRTELTDQIGETEKRNVMLESLKGDQSGEIEKMVKAVQGLKEELASQVVMTEKAVRDSKMTKNELADQTAESERLQKAVESLREELNAGSEKQMKEISSVKQNQSAEMAKIAGVVTKLMGELDDHEAVNGTQRDEIERLKGQIDLHIIDIRNKGEQIGTLTSQHAEEKKMRAVDVESLSSKLALEVSNLAISEKTILSLQGDRIGVMDKMTDDVKVMKATIADQASMGATLAQQAAKESELKEAVKISLAEIVEKNAMISGLREDVADQAIEVENLQKAVVSLRKELAEQAQKMNSSRKTEEESNSQLVRYKDASTSNESTIEKMKLEIVELNKQLLEKSKAALAFDECNIPLSDKESSFKNQLRVMMFEKKKVELELEKAQESGYALDLVSKQNISAITAEKDRLEILIKKLKSQLAAASDKTNDNLTAFMAERQKLKADIIRIQRDADLIEVTAKTDVDVMTAEHDKMHAEWLDKTSQFDILKKAADEAKSAADVLSKINVTLAADLRVMTSKVEDLASELDNAETQAAERELALSSTITVTNSKIDCLEKILEESQILKMRSDADCSNHLANFQDLSINLDNAEQEAMERELALTSTVTVTTSKLDCLEKILEESMTEKSLNDSRCLDEYTALCLKIGSLENDLEESKGTISELESRVSTLLSESKAANAQLGYLKSKTADSERGIDDKLKVLQSERKNLEADLKEAREDLKNIDRASQKSYNTLMADRDSLEVKLKKANSDIASITVKKTSLESEVQTVRAAAAAEAAALIAAHKAEILRFEEEEESRADIISEEVSESFLVEICALNDELTSVNGNLTVAQENFEKSQLENSTLEGLLKEAETFSSLERQRHENQVIQLLKIVGIYDEASADPLDSYWIDLFRIQMDEERTKIMTLKNCLMRFTSSLSQTDNGLLRGAGIILVGNKTDV